MKTLVLYATRTGRTYDISRKIADELGAELAPISDGKNYAGFFGYIRAAVAGLKKDPQTHISLGAQEDLDAYERIILAGPIWAENWCSISRGFLKEYGSKINCPIHFVFTHMSPISYDRCATDADKYLKAPHEGFLSISTKIKSDVDKNEYDMALNTFIESLKKSE